LLITQKLPVRRRPRSKALTRSGLQRSYGESAAGAQALAPIPPEA
jgi:hypothetical protein